MSLLNSSKEHFSLPVLYKRGAHDIRVWHIDYDREKECLITGKGSMEAYQKGTMQEYVREVVEKGGRTIDEQGELEARSRWNDKIKEGFQEELIDETVLSQPCMLANTYRPESRQIKHFPVAVQRKIDGIRCLAHFVLEDMFTAPKRDCRDELAIYFIPDLVEMAMSYLPSKEVILRSRKKTVFNHLNHLRRHLTLFLPFVERVLLDQGRKFPLFRLDGELYSHELSFNILSGISHISAKYAPSPHERKVHYYIFDIDLGDKTPFLARYEILATAFEAFRQEYESNLLHLVEVFSAESKQDIKDAHDLFVFNGFEGVIIRKISEPLSKDMAYVPARCSNLLKYKEFKETEGRVTGANEGKGSTEKGTIIWVLEYRGKTFKCRPRGSQNYKREMLIEYDKDPEAFIGRLYRFRYQRISQDGIPIFPSGIGFVDDR
jgi:hypothetical protein